MSVKSHTNVKILSEYYREIEKIIAQSNQFHTVSDYVNYVLQQMFAGENDSGYSPEEEEIVKRRLQDLGYM